MDNLGVAQYLSRLGMLLGDLEALDAGKEAWLNDAEWQPLRRYVEDSMMVRDPFELFVAQNVALDGLLYPLVYERIVDDFLSAKGASAVAMLTQFMSDWFGETRKWIDAVLKVAAAESAHNNDVLKGWISSWSSRAASALVPIVDLALGAEADEAVGEQLAAFKNRIQKTGIAL
jgi:phenol hydroxylase P1 protein